MAKKLIKKYLPHPKRITDNRLIKILGPRLQEPDLWHINRKSCSGAVAVGLFFAFMPVPFQMLLAAIGAIYFRYNVLIAVPMVWLSNPVTIPPIFYFCYRLGALLLGVETGEFHFELTFEWLMSGLIYVWQPLLLGCCIAGAVAATIGFAFMRLMWRYHIWTHIKQRRLRIKR